MSWFVDASALVAIIGREPDREEFADRIDEEAERVWLAVSRWESVVAVRTRLELSTDAAAATVDEIATLNGFTLVPIAAAETDGALAAMHRYGKASGSKANLNMGDCFAYACARTNGARLLYKGNDFSHTDMAL